MHRVAGQGRLLAAPRSTPRRPLAGFQSHVPLIHNTRTLVPPSRCSCFSQGPSSKCYSTRRYTSTVVMAQNLDESSSSRESTSHSQSGNVQMGPTELYYPYEAVVKKWESYLVWKGVPKTYPKLFLSQNALVFGSGTAPKTSVWSKSHVFYKCIDASSRTTGLYFHSISLNELWHLISSAHPSIDPSLLRINSKKGLSSNKFSSIEPITFNTIDELQRFRAAQVPSANADLLASNRRLYALFSERKTGTVVAVDVESYEHNHAIILEIGWSSVAFDTCPETGELRESRDCQHFIISENRYTTNGQWTPNNKDRFNFGQSHEVPLQRVMRLLSSELSDASQKGGPVVLVFHSAAAEIDYFSKMGLDTSKWIKGVPSPVETMFDARSRTPAIHIVDTQKLVSASGLPGARAQVGLKNALEMMGIPARNLHNAGNDACYTLALYEALAGPGRIKEDLIKEDQARQSQRLTKPKPRIRKESQNGSSASPWE